MAEMDHEKDELKKKRQSYQARLMDVKERISKKDGDEEALKVGHCTECTAHLLLRLMPGLGVPYVLNPSNLNLQFILIVKLMIDYHPKWPSIFHRNA